MPSVPCCANMVLSNLIFVLNVAYFIDCKYYYKGIAVSRKKSLGLLTPFQNHKILTRSQLTFTMLSTSADLKGAVEDKT